MSITSGEVFAEPSRPADFVPHGGNKTWMPTDTEPAQLRWRAVASEENQNPLGHINLLCVEQLAAAGMRGVFEHFDIRSFYATRTESETYDTPVVVHEAALTFPSSARHAQLVDDFASTSRGVERYRIRHCDGHYNGVDLLSALDDNKLLMSTCGETERPGGNGSTYYLHFFAHDLTIHFPAWLCLPRDMSQRIRRKATDTLREHELVTMHGPYDLGRLEASQKKINKLGHLLDQTVNIWRMGDLLDGKTEQYDTNMSQILDIKSTRYSESTLEHIASPREDEVLAARQLGW